MSSTAITTEADYHVALKEIESLMAAKTHTPEGDRLDELATLVEAYERTQQFTSAETFIKQSAVKPS